MEYEDLKVGQHLWVLSYGSLLMVAKLDGDDYDGYEVCGAWECGISQHDCEIIELVNPPKGHEKTPRYY